MGAACPIPALFAAKFTFLDPKVYVPTLLFAGALLAMAIAIGFVQRWRKRAANETFSTHDQLASFRILYERGELSQEEFERIRRQLLGRLKKGEAEPAAPDAVPDSPPPACPPAPPQAPAPE